MSSACSPALTISNNNYTSTFLVERGTPTEIVTPLVGGIDDMWSNFKQRQAFVMAACKSVSARFALLSIALEPATTK